MDTLALLLLLESDSESSDTEEELLLLKLLQEIQKERRKKCLRKRRARGHYSKTKRVNAEKSNESGKKLVQCLSAHDIAMTLPETEACNTHQKSEKDDIEMDIPLCKAEHVDVDYIEQHNASETASVTSGLTRMWVSDEDEKGFLQDAKNI